MNKESKLTKFTLIAAALLLTAYFATDARAAEDEFSGLWRMSLNTLLEAYIDFEDKDQADETLDNWIDGHVAGILSTYSYQAGMSGPLAECIDRRELSPAKIRKYALQAGSNPVYDGLLLGPYVYGMIHLSCTDVLGEYDTEEEEESTS